MKRVSGPRFVAGCEAAGPKSILTQPSLISLPQPRWMGSRLVPRRAANWAAAAAVARASRSSSSSAWKAFLTCAGSGREAAVAMSRNAEIVWAKLLSLGIKVGQHVNDILDGLRLQVDGHRQADDSGRDVFGDRQRVARKFRIGGVRVAADAVPQAKIDMRPGQGFLRSRGLGGGCRP